MIVTEIYNGQGLGNQLWCYVTTRVIAKDKGYDFGIQSPEKFKCWDFLELDFGKPVIGGSGPEGGPPRTLPEGIKYYYNERRLNHPENGVDIRTFDANLVNIPDHTKIDGIMQDEQYIRHRKAEIRKWLKVKKGYEYYDYASDDICIINFRGGEYVHIKNVFLPQKYWDDAICHMRKINPNFRFVVITDDVKTARRFFPKFEVHHFSIAKDYAVIKNAHYLILSNSSFACFPAWLNEKVKLCIAPKYWSQYNTSDGYWGCSYNMIEGWMYLDREGKLSSYKDCQKEFKAYQKAHPSYFEQVKIKENFLVVSNYYNDLSWVPEYTNNYQIYDQSDVQIYPPKLNKKKVIKSAHLGHNIRDYCSFIIEHYDNLPDRTIFSTGNIFPRHIARDRFDRLVNNQTFTPLEDVRRYKIKWPVSFLSSDGGYCEINNSWYLNHHPTKYFHNYNDFLQYSFSNAVIPRYIRFAPGANYIVPKENILRLPKTFYENLRTFVSHCETAIPGESHILERAFHTIWNANFEVSEAMRKPFDPHTFSPIPKKLGLKARIKQRISLNKNRAAAYKTELAEYRQNIKIYDIFTFFNELELLEIRLNILVPYVDYFIIVESRETFSGLPKKLIFKENEKRFAKFRDKIIHFVIEGVPKSEEELRARLRNKQLDPLEREIIQNALSSDNVPKGELHWLKEFYQKESLKKALVGLQDNDIVFVSDVDEIWNPNTVYNYQKDDIFKLRQLVYAYYLNNRSSEWWAGTLMTKYKNIKNSCLNHLRTARKTKYTYVKNGGWHFTNQGGPDRIRKKLESYGHQEFNNSTIKDDLENKIKKNRDFIGRKFKFWVDERALPQYLKEHRSKYKEFFK